MTTRRELVASGAAALLGACAGRQQNGAAGASHGRPRPSLSQLAWQRDELAMFLHFGVNTFTDREWGDGTESPRIFNPVQLDVGQWTRTAKAAGFRTLILTAKHHDGFCLWPSRLTDHSVRSSPWRDGRGDLVRELADACRAAGLSLGLYLSPWDRHEPGYGDTPRYNDFYAAQLTELLTQYGPVAEVWFDGANGEGPNGRRQQYDWPRVHALVRRLQPGAVMFSDAGPDVRWIGNENGSAGDTNWSTVDPSRVPYAGYDGPGVTQALQEGDANGSAWRPGETDVSIRPGWFWHPAQDGQVRSADNLLDLYFTSVGRNSKLLLNVPPTTQGLLHDTDVTRLAEFAALRRRVFETDFALNARHDVTGGAAETVVELSLVRSAPFDVLRLEEPIEQGQCIERYRMEAWTGREWVEMCRGTTIGYRKLDRFAPATTARVRVTASSALGTPRLSAIGLHKL